MSTQKKIIAIEIGAGKTILTIQKASENFAKTYPLIRVNPHDFKTTGTNHIPVKMPALDFMRAL